MLPTNLMLGMSWKGPGLLVEVDRFHGELNALVDVGKGEGTHLT